ncbi:MAG TPA: DUF6491 family protein [Steroidobacteraceae bacterium]|nr:DUF6491 family protein [Steroidobacteraceae bacterium]
MRNHRLGTGFTVAALAVLAACTTVPPDRPGTELPARARYMPYLGPPIDSFTWMMRFDGWEALSDSELLIFMGADSAYYLKVWAPCGTQGLRFAHVVGLTSSVGGTVTARLDSVRTEGMNCPISEIRKLDYKRFRDDARSQRAAEKAAGAPGSAPPPAETRPAPPHP